MFTDAWKVDDVTEWGVAGGTLAASGVGEPSLYSNEIKAAGLVATLNGFTKDTQPPDKGTGTREEIERGKFPSSEFKWECLKKT